jgi:outer membrane immunogenic protein
MRKILSATCVAGVIGSCGAASASEPFTNFRWSGAYVGGFVGIARGDSTIRTEVGPVVVGSTYFQSTQNAESVEENGSGSISPDRFIGGITVGANARQGNWVFGLEADLGAFNLGGSAGASNVAYPTTPPSTYTVRAAMDTDWLFTARGRLGWNPKPDLLIYGTAGLALTNLRVSNSFSDNADSAGVGGGSNSETLAGWTLGAGAEWVLSGQWTVKAEYLYLDFGTVTTRNSVACGPGATFNCGAIPIVPSAFSTSADLSAHIARVGLNYAF